MEGSNPTTPPESLAQALGGINVPVTFRDGTSGTAFVRELRLKQYDGMMAALGDDEALLRAYTDQPAGWADTLTVEALDAVLKTGDELNALGFTRWHARRLERNQRLLPKLKQRADEETQKIVEAIVTRLLPLGALPSAASSSISPPPEPSASPTLPS